MFETSDLLADNAKKGSVVGDFSRSLVHAALENPVNGVVQIINRTGAGLPELDIVRDVKPSAVSAAGELVGSVGTFFALNAVGGKVMGDLGGKGLTGSVLRAGITGAVFQGVLTPSDFDSNTFWTDRVKNGLVGAATFSSMAAAAGGLDRTGLFAVPEARTFLGSVGYGAVAGLAGGIGHAQADAMFNKGQLFASGRDYASDAFSYAAFGGAFGALGYGVEKVSSSLQGRVQRVNSDKGNVEIKMNGNGEVVRVQTEVPSVTHSGMDVRVTNYKMTDGRWSASAGARYTGDRTFWVPANSYNVSQVNRTPDGTIRVLDGAGDVRSFTPGGEYAKYQLGSRITGHELSQVNSYGSNTVLKDNRLTVTDAQGNVTKLQDMNANSLSHISYDRQGNIDWLSTYRQGGNEVSLHKRPDGWHVSLSKVLDFREGGINSKSTSGATFRNWNGTVRPVDGSTLRFQDGNRSFDFRLGSETQPLEAFIYQKK